jgi:peptidylprolyl isomerase
MRPPSFLSLGIAGFMVLGVAASATVIATSQPDTCEVPVTATTAASLVSIADVTDTPIPDTFFPTPLKTTGIERLSVTEGNGQPALNGSAVDFQVSVFFGATNEFVTSSSYDSAEPVRRVIDSESDDFFSRELQCVTTGERVVFTSTIADVFGPIPEDEIVQNTSTVVLVVDIQQAYLPRPVGRASLPERGLPQVLDHPEGFHGVSFPMAPPPADLAVQTVIQGDGAPVSDGDRVVVQYTGVVWQTQSVFSSSFEQSFPVTLSVADGSLEGATTGVISGVYEALVGSRVGSRVLSVIPPEFGYPAGSQPPGVPEGATLVYVFDILGIE